MMLQPIQTSKSTTRDRFNKAQPRIIRLSATLLATVKAVPPTQPAETLAQSLQIPEQILTAHTPVLEYIPTELRGRLADTYAATMQDAIKAFQRGSPFTIAVVTKLFLFHAVMWTNTLY